MKISIQTGDIVDRLGFEAGYPAIKAAGFEITAHRHEEEWHCFECR